MKLYRCLSMAIIAAIGGLSAAAETDTAQLARAVGGGSTGLNDYIRSASTRTIANTNVLVDAIIPGNDTVNFLDGAAVLATSHPGNPASLSRGDFKAAFAVMIDAPDDSVVLPPVDCAIASLMAAKSSVDGIIVTRIIHWVDAITPGNDTVNFLDGSAVLAAAQVGNPATRSKGDFKAAILAAISE